ncbi:MAG TPA: Crp/Fnr family transcriptional regulator [Gemmatimonadales bacterium]|jgi:CRP-like cAMP-binding protein
MTTASSTGSDSAIEQLRRVPLFAHLSDIELGRIRQAVREKGYPRGSVILFEHDPGDALYVVIGGQVKVVLIAEDGREVILALLKEGDFFGEMSLIDDQPRSAHVIATEDAQLLVLRRDDFLACMDDMPRIALGLLRALSRRLRQADDKIGGLVLLDVNGRLARLLLDLADEDDGQHITRRVTHHTLAQMIGSSRETVSRTLRDLSARGLIEVGRKQMVIRDRGGLEALAGIM